MNSPFGLIQFKGDKALLALHGQCTQMVSNLSEGYAPLVAFCDPRGRMYGSGRLIIHQGIVSLITPIDQAEAIVARLTPFLMLARVAAEITSIPLALTSQSDLEPSTSHHASTSTRVGEYGRTQWVIGDPTAEHSSFADSSRLLSGLGYVRSYSAEQCIPQQAHYQILNGVSFQKGCYTGQEVIARLEHLGQSKKHLRIYQSLEDFDGQTLELEGLQLPVFDAVTTIDGSTALVLAPVGLSSDQLINVPFEISRQVEGQRPVKL